CQTPIGRDPRDPLFHEVIARKRWPHVGAREEQRHDDFNRGAAPKPLAADGSARRFAAIPVELDEQIVHMTGFVNSAPGFNDQPRVRSPSAYLTAARVVSAA